MKRFEIITEADARVLEIDVKRVTIGSDHSGVALERDLIRHLRGLGLAIADVGTPTSDPVDHR
jgi:hypothetical protein